MEKAEVLNYVPKGRNKAIPSKEICDMVKKENENPPDPSTIRGSLSELKEDGFVERVSYDDFTEKEKEKYDNRFTLYFIPFKEEEKSWYGKNLLPLLGLLLQCREINKPGYFCFPLSKENVIKNLHRITGEEKAIIKLKLERFEKQFVGKIQLKPFASIKYEAKWGKNCYHRPGYCPSDIKNPEKRISTSFYSLEDDFKKEVQESLDQIEIDETGYFSLIFSNLITPEGREYLQLLKEISIRSMSKDICSPNDVNPRIITETLENFFPRKNLFLRLICHKYGAKWCDPKDEHYFLENRLAGVFLEKWGEYHIDEKIEKNVITDIELMIQMIHSHNNASM